MKSVVYFRSPVKVLEKDGRTYDYYKVELDEDVRRIGALGPYFDAYFFSPKAQDGKYTIPWSNITNVFHYQEVKSDDLTE